MGEGKQGCHYISHISRVILGFAKHEDGTAHSRLHMWALNVTCAIVNGVLGILGVIVAGGNASSRKKKTRKSEL